MKHGKILSTAYCGKVLDWLENTNGSYLEIGVYNGVFLSQVAETFPQYNVFGIDPFIGDGHTGEPQGSKLSDQLLNARKNIEEFTNVKLWELTTKECLDNHYYRELSEVSCVLVDGSHHYDDILIDFKFILQIRNSKNMLVLFDDLHIKDVVDAISFFEKEHSYRIISKMYDTPTIVGFELNTNS
jgi:hypothetical protein